MPTNKLFFGQNVESGEPTSMGTLGTWLDNISGTTAPFPSGPTFRETRGTKAIPLLIRNIADIGVTGVKVNVVSTDTGGPAKINGKTISTTDPNGVTVNVIKQSNEWVSNVIRVSPPDGGKYVIINAGLVTPSGIISQDQAEIYFD